MYINKLIIMSRGWLFIQLYSIVAFANRVCGVPAKQTKLAVQLTTTSTLKLVLLSQLKQFVNKINRKSPSQKVCI